MAKIDRCTATTKLGRSCPNKINRSDNIHGHPFCLKHLTIYAFKDFGCCYICKNPCNPCSQACGRCMKKNMFFR
jgi:hypothetical protein